MKSNRNTITRWNWMIGLGQALDGKPKFDLRRFDRACFDRLRSRVIAARDRGIYASLIMLGLAANGVLAAAAAAAAPARIPALQWEERSEWINVKTDLVPAAIGDGQADDTVAIQNALSAVRGGPGGPFQRGPGARGNHVRKLPVRRLRTGCRLPAVQRLRLHVRWLRVSPMRHCDRLRSRQFLRPQLPFRREPGGGHSRRVRALQFRPALDVHRVTGLRPEKIVHRTTHHPGLPCRGLEEPGGGRSALASAGAALRLRFLPAAAASGRAIAYLPTGRYIISSTLRITGKDFFVGGSGWCTQLIWKGPEDGTMLEVRDPQRVVLEGLMIGAHDAGAMNNRIDIQQRGSTNGSRMTYDGVYVFGMYQKAPLRKGLRLTNLGEKDVVVMAHVQGNLGFVDCGRATVLANCSYEGSVVVEGQDKARDGLLGFQTRLATIVTHGLYLRDNHSMVMSDFYVEQADNGFLFEGAADDPPGRATITGAKFQSFQSNDPAKNNLLDIRNYHGQIAIGPYQFYQEPKRMRMKQQGAESVDLLLWASSWYGAKPDPQLGPAAKLSAVGNAFYGTAPDVEPVVEQMFFQEASTEAALTQLSRALDDLRRLGEIDLRLNHPEASR